MPSFDDDGFLREDELESDGKSGDKPQILAYQGNDPYIFISYAHEDSHLVYHEIERFYDDGYKIWYDEGIPSGRRWQEVVESALRDADLFVIFISNNALASDNVIDEALLAKRRGIPIISIYLEPCELVEGLELSLTSATSIRKYKLDENRYVLYYRALFENHGFNLNASDIDERIDNPPFPAYRGEDPYIFISYAHDDSKWVFSDIERFHNDGCNIWYDEGIPSGERWQGEIERVVKNAKLFVTFISNNAVESDNVLDEIFLAIRNKIDIIPIFLESVRLDRGLDLKLSNKQSIYRYRMSEKGYVDRYRKDFKEKGFDIKVPQIKQSKQIAGLDGEGTEEIIKVIENKFSSLDETDRNYFIQLMGLYADASSNQNEKLLEEVNSSLQSILANIYVEEYFETIENAPDVLSYPSLLLNLKSDLIRYEIIHAAFLKLEKRNFTSQDLADELIRQGHIQDDEGDIEELEKTVVKLYRGLHETSSLKGDISEESPQDNAFAEKAMESDDLDEGPIDDYDTIYLKEFAKLNTTTNSIYDLGDYGVLIILKDGSNLTSWDDVENKEDVLYVSEDLSEFIDLTGKYKDLSSLKSILAMNVTCSVTNMKYMFSGCSSLEDISSLKDWNTGNVGDMNGMFNGCASLQDISALKDWNVSNVGDMNGMFDGCTSLEDISALKDWDVANVADLSGMFYSCSALIDTFALKNWDIGNVKFMSRMFRGCTSLVDVSALKNWDTANVNDMNAMFKGCSALVDIFALKNWNIKNATDLSGVFYDCSSLKDILALKGWKTASAGDMSGMFKGCSSLEDLSALKDWKTANVVDMSEMFEGCSSLMDILPLKNWNTKKLKDTTRMFSNCSSLGDVSALKDWDASNVIYMNEMFDDSINVKKLPQWYNNRS